MKLQFLRASDNVMVVQATFNEHDQVERTVIDTASQTGPVPADRYVADQGGTRPLPVPQEVPRDRVSH